MLHERVGDYYALLPPALQNVVVGITWGLLAWIGMTFVRKIVLGRVKAMKYVDDTLDVFLDHIVKTAGWVVVIVAALLGFGVPAAALGGLLAVGGFVVGFAVKDTLGNLAAGAVLLMNRPYNVGESVHVKGHDGAVESLGISMTTLKTWDGRMVTVPNGAILSDAILNHSRNPVRRAEIAVGIGYGDDIDLAIRTSMRILEEHADVLPDPAPQVLVTGMGDSAIDMSVRGWVNTPDFVRVWSDLNHKVKVGLEGAGLSIPFPQRDVHLHQVNAG